MINLESLEGKVHSSILGRDIKQLDLTGSDKVTQELRMNIAQNPAQLSKIGIGFDSYNLNKIYNYERSCESTGMDADYFPTLTTPSVTTPIQFLQEWMPGYVKVMSWPRKIDYILGIDTIGSWELEQVVQGIVEKIGTAQPYSDYTNLNLASYNANYEYRTIVRFEQDVQDGYLEAARAARVRINNVGEKRMAAMDLLEIERNRVGFYGYNSTDAGGRNRTDGLLNAAESPAFVQVPEGASGETQFVDKSVLERIKDFLTGFTLLQSQSNGLIDPVEDPTTLVMAVNANGFLNDINEFGISVKKWLDKTYPKCRVISCPEFNTVVGTGVGAGGFYIFADKINNSGSDNNNTYTQMVPAKIRTLGVEQRAKGYVESHTNATAGVMLKRPYAVVRFFGISDNVIP